MNANHKENKVAARIRRLTARIKRNTEHLARIRDDNPDATVLRSDLNARINYDRAWVSANS